MAAAEVATSIHIGTGPYAWPTDPETFSLLLISVFSLSKHEGFQEWSGYNCDGQTGSS